ncbi:MAG: PAS domain-containing sensor histidine kinase [Candidatus Obscuribacterales bacterium]|nr:PAS domain-containing sensor histidine kinase [Candidatus Obscuribacterales bacterium]
MRLDSKLKLIHRGLILVCVPLLFELVIVSVLLYQTYELEAEINKEKQAKLIQNSIGDTVSQFYKIGQGLNENLWNSSIESFEQWNEQVESLPRIRQDLKETLKHTPLYKSQGETLMAPLQEFETQHLDLARDLILQRLLLSQQACGPEEFVKIIDTELFDEIKAEGEIGQNFSVSYSEKLNKIFKTIKGSQRESPKKQQQIRDQQKTFLFVAMIGSIVLALQLAFFFVTGIVKRLLTITDNTLRLKEERELNPPVGGKDEIALLDGVFHDMTKALKQSREKEREMMDKIVVAEARVRSTIENMPVGVLMLDEEGIIQSINPRTETLFRREPSELIEKSFEPLFQAPQKLEISLLKHLISEQGKNIELNALRSEDETFFADVILNEVNTFEGKRYLVSIQDATERHELERVKQEFYAMIAHDLRSPLMSTQMSLALVVEGILGEVNPKMKTALERAELSTKRLTGLINDFLDFEKLQSGKFELKSKPMYISNLIERSVSEVQGLADKGGLTIETPDMDAMTYADEDRLIQVLINFLSNAIKYSPENSTITIQAKKIEREILIAVKDQGPGIPAELQSKLFKSFSMLDNQPGSGVKIKGTGLGLAISKMIIEQHEGTIGVDSKDGEGSSFWFRIPIKSSA